MVVLGTVPVAAAGPTFGDGDVTIDDSESWVGIAEDHTVTIMASDVNSTDGPATVTVDLSGWDAEHLKSDPSVTIKTSGVGLVGSVDTTGTTTEFDVNDTNQAVFDLEVELAYALDHPVKSSFDGNQYRVDASITDATGTADSSAELTLQRVSYEVDGTERYPPSTEFVYQNQTVTATNLESGTAYVLYEFYTDNETTGDAERSFTSTGSTESFGTAALNTGWYVLVGGNSTAIEQNAFRLQRHQLDATQASGEVYSTGDGAETSVTLDSSRRTTSFDVDVTSPVLDAEELYDVFDGEANADVEHVGDSDTKIRLKNVTPGDQVPMTFSPVTPGTYEFDFEARDTNAADSSSVTVREREFDASFGKTTYETQAGELVTIDLSLQDIGEAYVIVGGSQSNYFDILHVSGSTTFQINTRLLGTNVPSDEIYVTDGGSVTSYLQDPDAEVFDDVTFEGDAENIQEFRSEIGISPLPRPLQPGLYRLVAGRDGSVVIRDDGVSDFEYRMARSNFRITESDGFGNVTTYVAPEGSANEITDPGNLGELRGMTTERQTVARGDRLVFEFELRGLTGLLTWLEDRLGSTGEWIDPQILQQLLAFPDGLRIDAAQTNPGINQQTTRLDLSRAGKGDLYLVPESVTQTGDTTYYERFYLVVDTRGKGPFTSEPRAGDEYRFQFGYNQSGQTDWFKTVDHDALDPNGAAPHFPYYGEERGNDTDPQYVRIEKPAIEYAFVDNDGRPIVRGSKDAEISGETNLAPGTAISMDVTGVDRDGNKQVWTQDLDIGADGGFSFGTDLSSVEPGTTIDVEFYLDQELFDRRSALVVGPDEKLVDYNVSSPAGAVTVTSGERFGEPLATVENTGYITGNQSLTLSIDGETIAERQFEVGADGSKPVDFGYSTVDLEPGEYNYTISSDDTEMAGRLRVESTEEPDGDTETGSSAGTGAEPTSSEEEPSVPLGDESGGLLGPIPAFPIGTRVTIGGAVIVGAVHVLGFWG